MKMNLSNKKKRRRPKRKFMKIVKDNLKVVGLIEEDVVNRERWKRIICCDDHRKGKHKLSGFNKLFVNLSLSRRRRMEKEGQDG